MDGNLKPAPKPKSVALVRRTPTATATATAVAAVPNAAVMARRTGGGEVKDGFATFNNEQKQAVATLFGALQQYGPAPGAKVLLERERAAAEHAIGSGIETGGGGGVYVTWQCASRKSDCTRIGPDSMCFCGHKYGAHTIQLSRNSYPCASGGCACRRYKYLPTRPEEVGEWWLPRRKEFNIHTYAVKCTCGHPASAHNASNDRRCSAGGCGKCAGWNGNYACVVCDRKDCDHEVVWETEAERRARGAPVGADYLPFAELPQIADLVFRDKSNRTSAVGTASQFARPRPKPKPKATPKALPAPKAAATTAAADASESNDAGGAVAAAATATATNTTAAAAAAAAPVRRTVRSQTTSGAAAARVQSSSAAVADPTDLDLMDVKSRAAAAAAPAAARPSVQTSIARPAASRSVTGTGSGARKPVAAAASNGRAASTKAKPVSSGSARAGASGTAAGATAKSSTATTRRVPPRK